jgi:peptidoglycan LD-endopeptidase LytH
MARIRTSATILITAVVTCIATSIFWIIVYNGAAGSAGQEQAAAVVANLPPGKTVTATIEPDNRPQLVVAPSGLAVPVAGIKASDLLDTYTQSRAGGARVHNAIDIMAPEGTPVVAAAEGVVEKLYLSRGGGGITVYVRSPDRQWIYYYAHLQEYAPGLQEGQRVARGARLGSVGTTGNASTAGPHLHFAVNRMAPGERWHEGTPVNPYPLLAGTGR